RILTATLTQSTEGHGRPLAFSQWAASILDRSVFQAKHDFIPHGIDTSLFFPRHYRAARNGFGVRLGARNSKGKWLAIPSDAFFIGIVATNQARKDFGLGIRAAAELAKKKDTYLWIHTDVLERHWSLPGLIYDYGIDNERVVITCDMHYTDEQMAWAYSACDVTLGIGNGEGFGYPIFE